VARKKKKEMRTSVLLPDINSSHFKIRDLKAEEEAEAEEKVKQLFKRWDTDGSGGLSKEEFKVVMKKVGMKSSAASKIFAAVDSDGSGKIEIDEFLAWTRSNSSTGYQATVVDSAQKMAAQGHVEILADMVTIPSQYFGASVRERSRMDKLFKEWDGDVNGKIDEQEFRTALQKYGWTEAQIRSGYAAADKDASGSIEIDEFVNFLFGTGTKFVADEGVKETVM